MYKLISRNDNFLVISKAAGVGFHRQDGACGLAAKIKADLSLPEIYPVHRLDKVTSGLLIFAINRGSASELAGQFGQRRVEKYYLAIAAKKPRKKQGMIMADMVKARRGSWKLAATKTNPAITQFFSKSMAPGLRLFILKPHTGRTHQLRVAMKSIAAPVLGDPRYGPADLQIDRACLHSYVIRFTLHDIPYTFVDLPQDGHYFCGPEFRIALREYEHPWRLAWPRLKKS